MTTPVWVPKGLVALDSDNFMSQILKNVAYFVELYAQVNDDTIDPSYSGRTSKQKRMVFLSNPPVNNPLYPVCVVSMVSNSGYGIGLNPVRYNYMVQVAVVGKKGKQSSLEKIVNQINKAVHEIRNDLHDVGMYYVRDSIPASFQSFRRDGDNPQILYGTVSYAFYSII